MAVSIATALLFNGAVEEAVRFPIMLLLGVSGGFALIIPVKSGLVLAMIRRTLFLCIGLAVWVVLQSLRLPLWLPVHPVWHDLAATFGTDYGYLSVNPSKTWRALPSLLLPVLVFATSLIITQDEALARRFWTKLTALGLVVVVVCILRQLLFPDSLIFSGEALRTGQFSGVFINRNVAAAAFGLTGFAVLGCLAIQLSQDRSLRQRWDRRESSRNYWTYVFLGMALFLTAVCLILTRSRAGSLGSLVLLLPCLSLILGHGLRYKFVSVKLRRRRRMGIGIALITLTVFLAAFGEPVLSRVETTKNDLRWCTWEATVGAINDHLLFGSGLGTFSDVFPRYRNVACDVADIVWLRAHNSFLEAYLVLGFPSILFVGAVAVSLGQIIAKGTRLRRRLKGIPIAMAGAAVFVTVHSLVDFPLQIPGIALYFSALMGAGTTLCMRVEGDDEPKSSLSLR
ncbi:O-antigen ligase family protein [Yoonia sp.]|uniref:O-antigen ligase family protein n=1 Tax=Yoonia sp. TaxID=2212373 RepID=UPI00358FC0B5